VTDQNEPLELKVYKK